MVVLNGNKVMKAEIQTLLYLVRDEEVLLIVKKRGLGAGLYNGVGGKVESSENILGAAIRECEEEVCVKPLNPEWMALLEFINEKADGSREVIYVHVFLAKDWEGTPVETEEARPVWVKINEIPFDIMWEDDIYWLPPVLKGEKVFASFLFEEWKLKGGRAFQLKDLTELGGPTH